MLLKDVCSYHLRSSVNRSKTLAEFSALRVYIPALLLKISKKLKSLLDLFSNVRLTLEYVQYIH